MPRAPHEEKITASAYRLRTNTKDVSDVRYDQDYLRDWTNGQNSPLYPDVLRVNPVLVHLKYADRVPGRNYQFLNSGNWSERTGTMRNIGGLGDPPLYSLASVGSPEAQEAERIATNRVISKISKQKVNLLQNVGEYRQVYGMFNANTRRLVNAWRAVRHADVYGLYRALPLTKKQKAKVARQANNPAYTKAPAQWWLELQYGWLPLVGDVYDSLTNFYRRVEEGILIKETGGRSHSWEEVAPYVDCGGFVRCAEIKTFKVASKCGVWYRVDSAQLANLQDWGVLNPALLAWELMPYSFVVDWFLPVGDWLSKVDYSLGLSFHDGYSTVFAKGDCTRVYMPKVRTPADGSWIWDVRGRDTFREVNFDRRRLGAFPSVPPPRFVPDGLRGKRIANALALLRVAFSR